MNVCMCACVHNAGEVSRDSYHRKEGKYKILITKLIQICTYYICIIYAVRWKRESVAIAL